MNIINIKEELEKKIQSDPYNDEAIIKLVSILIELTEFEKAYHLINNKVNIEPTIDSINYFLYLLLREREFYNGNESTLEEKVEEILNKAKKVCPTHYFSYSLIGELYINNNQSNKALEVLLESVDLKSTISNTNNLGMALYNLERYDEAKTYFMKAHSLKNIHNDSYIPYFNYALSLIKLNKLDYANEVATYLKEIISQEEQTELGILDVLKIFFFTSNYQELLDNYERVTDEYTLTPEEFEMYCYTLLKLNKSNQATELYNSIMEHYKECVHEVLNDKETKISIREDNANALKEQIDMYNHAYELIQSGSMPRVECVPMMMLEDLDSSICSMLIQLL